MALFVASAVAVAAVGSDNAGNASPAEPRPFARVGKTSETPEHNNGHFKSFGWGRSTAFCGLRDANLPGAPFIGKDASWWLAYNREALFVACLISLKPQGENFLAKTTGKDDPAIFEDDHLLIQVSLDPDVGQAGKPFLRLAVNPNGALWGSIIEALPGQNHPVDTAKIALGNHVGPHHLPGNFWIVRLRIPLEMLGVKSLDGQTAKMHLAWASKPLYLSWGGVKQDEWGTMPEVFFDPDPVSSFRLNGSYPFLFQPNGGLNMDYSGRLCAGTPEKPARFRLAMRNEAGGKTTWEKEWEAQKGSGEPYAFPARLTVAGVDAAGNRLTIEGFATPPGGEEQLFFRNILPYKPKSPEVNAALKQWQESHAYELKAHANFDFIYEPYSDRLDALVSTKLNPQLYAGAELEKANAIVAADRLRVAVLDAAGKELARGEGAVKDGAGNAQLQLPTPLPEGDYRVRLELLKGEAVADQGEMPMTRKKFEWEKSAIGREKVIIPPWEPVRESQVASRESGKKLPALSCWGRTYALQNNGLPSSMISQGGDVLGGPMRLTGVVDGKEVAAQGAKPPKVTLIPGEKFPADFAKYELANNACPVAGKDFQLEKTDGYAAEIEAQSELGPVAVSVKSRLDYDGLYKVNLTLTPRQAVTVDSLTLTVPIANSANLYRFSRYLDMNCLGTIPEGDGVLQKSSNLPVHPALTGSFAPVVFAGQYDHGLFWMAETDRGWSVDDTDDQVLLVREKGELSLKFRFIARPTTLDAPRTIEFAFIASPSRPKALAYRQAFWEGKRTHDTAGFRFYGDGVNGFQLYTPEDYEGLRKFIFESDGTARQYFDKADVPPGHKSYYKISNDMAKQGFPVTLYGCSWGANAGMREFPTFGSAWTHGTRQGRPAEEFKNWTNFGGTAKWTTPAQLTPVGTLMSDSFVDCWLWHMTRIGQHSGVNGCFFDCFESLPRALKGRVKTDIDGVAYRRDDGQLRPFACPLRYHERTRRYATALWLLGRPPSLLQSNNFDNTYGPTWYVEGDIYHEKVGQNLIIQGVTPDKAAAYTASCSGMGMCRSDLPTADPGKLSEAEEQCFAVVAAYGILYDLAWGGNPAWLSKTAKAVGAARKELSIGDPRVRHVRYWNAEDAKLIRASDKRVLAGGFVSPEKQRALVAVLNPTNETIEVDLSHSDALLGRAVSDVCDILAGPDLTPGPRVRLTMKPHETRMLLVK
jgi:hypothetical protein